MYIFLAASARSRNGYDSFADYDRTCHPDSINNQLIDQSITGASVFQM